MFRSTADDEQSSPCDPDPASSAGKRPLWDPRGSDRGESKKSGSART